MDKFNSKWVLTNADLFKLILTTDTPESLRQYFAYLNEKYYILDVPQKSSMYSMQAHIIHEMFVNKMSNYNGRVSFTERDAENIQNAKQILEDNTRNVSKYTVLKAAQNISEFTNLSVLSLPERIELRLNEQRKMFENFDQGFIRAINTELHCFDISKFQV